MDCTYIGGNMDNKLYIKIGKLIASHKVLYYVLNYTWGILGTIIGWLVFLFLKTFRKIKPAYCKHYKFNRLVNDWDYSFSIGTVVVCGWSPEIDILQHEIGHTIQNAMFGPLTIFIVYIPSAIRCQWRSHQEAKGKKLKTEYDDIWFEGSATYLGQYFNLGE